MYIRYFNSYINKTKHARYCFFTFSSATIRVRLLKSNKLFYQQFSLTGKENGGHD